jgi:hypothetical protein
LMKTLFLINIILSCYILYPKDKAEQKETFLWKKCELFLFF